MQKRPDSVRLNPELAIKRERIIREIITSEQTYVQQLRAIVEVFVQPLKEKSTQPHAPCSPRKMGMIFSNIENIFSVNLALLEALEIFVQKNSPAGLGDIFLRHFHFFRIYIPFVNNYEQMLRVLAKQLTRQNFAKFVSVGSVDPRCKGLNLQSLLITPVQRIPRYKMLVDELLRCTPKVDTEWGQLSDALHLISHVTDQVNTAIKNQERQAKLVELQSRFTKDILLVQPNRMFLRQDSMQKVCRKGNRKYEFILLSDAVLYAETVASNKLKFHNLLAICHTQVKLPHVTTQPSFQLLSPQKSFEVIAQSVSQRDSWVRDFQQAKTTLELAERSVAAELRYTLLQPEEPTFAPVWIPDSRAVSCQCCGVKFNLVRRRHHCRLCGRVICSQCSIFASPNPTPTTPTTSTPTLTPTTSTTSIPTPSTSSNTIDSDVGNPLEISVSSTTTTTTTLESNKRKCVICCEESALRNGQENQNGSNGALTRSTSTVSSTPSTFYEPSSPANSLHVGAMGPSISSISCSTVNSTRNSTVNNVLNLSVRENASAAAITAILQDSSDDENENDNNNGNGEEFLSPVSRDPAAILHESQLNLSQASKNTTKNNKNNSQTSTHEVATVAKHQLLFCETLKNIFSDMKSTVSRSRVLLNASISDGRTENDGLVRALETWRNSVRNLAIVALYTPVTNALSGQSSTSRLCVLEATWLCDTQFVVGVTVQWFRLEQSTQNGTLERIMIPHATDVQYVPSIDDVGCFVEVEVIPILASGVTGTAQRTRERIKAGRDVLQLSDSLLSCSSSLPVFFPSLSVAGNIRFCRQEKSPAKIIEGSDLSEKESEAENEVLWCELVQQNSDGVEVCLWSAEIGEIVVHVESEDPHRLCLRAEARPEMWIFANTNQQRDGVVMALRRVQQNLSATKF